MTPLALVVFHWTLGLVVLCDSARPVARTDSRHVALLASIEILAAILFLWPRAARLGALLLLAVFATAFGAHALRGELAGPLLVYAAGAALVGAQAGSSARRAK